MDRVARANLGRQRLMRDIKELVEQPYPNIEYRVHDDNMTSGCLILSPEDQKKLHLSVEFLGEYPLDPPIVSMDSVVDHPNVYGNYICATILRKTDEYTPAYTLKGIAIQMLSFFGSDSIEQEHGNGTAIDLVSRRRHLEHEVDNFECAACSFRASNRMWHAVPGAEYADVSNTKAGKRWSRRHGRGKGRIEHEGTEPEEAATEASESMSETSSSSPSVVLFNELGKPTSECYIERLPNEVLLLILEKLDDFEHLTRLAQAWPRVSQLVQDFDVIRQRELQCFVLKQTYRAVRLGVGVSVSRGGQVASEFDLVSHDAFARLGVRRSVHNIGFAHWLPLPISWRHWGQVRGGVDEALRLMAPKVIRGGAEKSPDPVRVLYHFMNDIVVRLNEVASKSDEKSTLRHASEKAIESYFHLFHLLVCMACETPAVVRQANAMLQAFAAGRRSKADCPNLGHLLVALLISDVEVDDSLRKAIITEAITRNVVWLLDGAGAGRSELSYLEPSAVSTYRLEQTFRGSLTSYRLLMFSELFRRTARPSCVSTSSGGSPRRRKSLLELREELFARHGAPPPGSAARLSAEVRRLHTVNSFPQFLREMGVRHMPTAANFTDVLRRTMADSVARGYSTWALPRYKALALRLVAEPTVEVDSEKTRTLAKGCLDEEGRVRVHRVTFFPRKQGRMDNGRERRGQGRRR